MEQLSLASMLAPHEETDFLEEVMGRSALYIPGGSSKFSALFSWQDLNHFLRFGALAYPRLRLFAAGQEIPPDAFMGTSLSGYPQPLSPSINTALQSGATLVIESIEDLHEPISIVSTSITKKLDLPVQIDLYARFPGQPPAARRWNDHEVLVMAVEGNSLWEIACPTADVPSPRLAPPEPAGEPAWRGSLSSGDALYVPKGWWYHEDCPEPSLYLAAKFRIPTGLDALHRMVEYLSGSRELRIDCPRADQPAEQSVFIRRFQNEITRACGRPGLIFDFQKHIRRASQAQNHFSLPWSAAPKGTDPPDTVAVKPLLHLCSDSLRYAADTDSAVAFINRAPVQFDKNALTIFEHVYDDGPTTVGALRAACEGAVSKEVFADVLGELAANGLIGLDASEDWLTEGANLAASAGV